MTNLEIVPRIASRLNARLVNDHWAKTAATNAKSKLFEKFSLLIIFGGQK
jgi:hypothetical protein